MSARLAFITGASSGIGQALAAGYARAGWRLALVARRAAETSAWAEAQGLQGGRCAVYAADVAQVDSIVATRYFGETNATRDQPPRTFGTFGLRCIWGIDVPVVAFVRRRSSLGSSPAEIDDFALDDRGTAANRHVRHEAGGLAYQ